MAVSAIRRLKIQRGQYAEGGLGELPLLAGRAEGAERTARPVHPRAPSPLWAITAIRRRSVAERTATITLGDVGL